MLESWRLPGLEGVGAAISRSFLESVSLTSPADARRSCPVDAADLIPEGGAVESLCASPCPVCGRHQGTELGALRPEQVQALP